MTEGKRTGRNAIFHLILGVALAAIAVFGAAYSYVWVTADLVLLVALTLTLGIRVRRGKPLPLPPILIPMGLLWLLVLGQYVGGSVYPELTLTGLMQLSGCGAMFYLAVLAFRRRRNWARLGVWLWGFTGVIASEAILQFVTSPGKIYWFHDSSYATPSGPFVYHNHFAGCMELLLPVAWVYALRPVGDGEVQWLAWLRRSIPPALGMLAVVMSGSRGGVLTLIFEAVLALVMFWRPGRLTRRSYVTATVVLLLVVGFGSLISWQSMTARFDRLGHHDVSSLDRLLVAESCLHIFRDHRWFGTGFETFEAVYPAYQLFDNGVVYDYAHNEYAQLLAETGLAGVVALLGFCGCYLYRGLRLKRDRVDREIKLLRQGALVGTLGLAFQSMGDFPFHNPSLALLFFLLAGALLAEPAAGRRGEQQRVVVMARKRQLGPAEAASPQRA